MQGITRRGFMAGAAAGALVLSSGRSFAARALRTGCQSYSFRNFPTAAAIQHLRALGLSEMEFCGVHFPADPKDPKFIEAMELIKAAGITVPSYGVQPFTADDAANRKQFEFAKALGAGILSADPTPDAFASLDKLVDEFNIKIAIHNHGPGARYDKVADTLKAVEGHSPLIGACLDTGHAIRSGEKPHEIIEQLGARVHSLHIKDWKFGGEEQILGLGDLDLEKVATALLKMKFMGPVMMEYENSPEGPVADMQKGLDNWVAAQAKATAALPPAR